MVQEGQQGQQGQSSSALVFLYVASCSTQRLTLSRLHHATSADAAQAGAGLTSHVHTLQSFLHPMHALGDGCQSCNEQLVIVVLRSRAAWWGVICALGVSMCVCVCLVCVPIGAWR